MKTFILSFSIKYLLFELLDLVFLLFYSHFDFDNVITLSLYISIQIEFDQDSILLLVKKVANLRVHLFVFVLELHNTCQTLHEKAN